jgi:hypothetical protein
MVASLPLEPGTVRSSASFLLARYPPRVSASGAIAQAPRRARASVLQKGFVVRRDDTL